MGRLERKEGSWEQVPLLQRIGAFPASTAGHSHPVTSVPEDPTTLVFVGTHSHILTCHTHTHTLTCTWRHKHIIENNKKPDVVAYGFGHWDVGRSLGVEGKPGLHNGFQDSQGYKDPVSTTAKKLNYLPEKDEGK